MCAAYDFALTFSLSQASEQQSLLRRLGENCAGRGRTDQLGEFELMPVSVIGRAGHRLRIAIAGADADTFRRIPEEGAPIIMVYRSAARPSHVARRS